MANISTATPGQTVGNTMPPTLGVTPLPVFVDDIFGTPTVSGKFLKEGANEQTNYIESVPEAFMGQGRTNLGQRIIMQHLLDDNFYIKDLAPIRPLDWNESLEVQWDTITFHPHMPQVLPEEGRTRIGSWEYSSQTDIINRFGLGVEFNHELLFTRKGQMLIRGLMAQLDDGIETHLKMGVVSCITHAPDFAHRREQETLQQNWHDRRIDEFFARTKLYWGVLQRLDTAVQLIETWIKREQETFGGTSNRVVIHWKVAMYITQVNPKFTTFSEIGDTARATLEAGVEGFGMWGEHKVYLVRSFDVDRENGPVDLLKREVVYGEFYSMHDHIPSSYGSYTGYKTSWRTVQLMDGDGSNDGWAPINIMEAARATGLWDQNGKIVGPKDPLLQDYSTKHLKGKDQRDSFWARDPRTGETKAIRYQCGILPSNMSTNSLLNLAFTAIQASPLTLKDYSEQRITGAIQNLQRAIAYMSNPPISSTELNTWIAGVIAQNADKARDAGRDFIVTAASGSLEIPKDANAQVGAIAGFATLKLTYPPMFISGSGLMQLKTQAEANELHPVLNRASCLALAADIETVDKFVASLQGIFGDSVFLNPSYVASSNRQKSSFAAFVDNILSQGRPPAWLRRPGVVKQDGSALGSKVDLEDALKGISTAALRAAEQIQERFTGRLTTVGSVKARFAGKAGVATISAKLGSVPGGGADDQTAIFEPTSSGADDTDATLLASLPPFAQDRFGRDAKNLKVDGTKIGDRSLFPYAEALGPVGVDAGLKAAYSALVRLLFNFAPDTSVAANYASDAVARRIANQSVDRSLVLSLITMINRAPAANAAGNRAEADTTETVKRINMLMENVLQFTSANPAALANMPNGGPGALDRQALRQAVANFFAKKPAEAADTFGMAKDAGTGQMVPRSAASISAVFDLIEGRAEQQMASVISQIKTLGNITAGTTSAPAGARPQYSTADYKRSDLRISPELLLILAIGASNGEQPMAMPSDPNDFDNIMGYAQMQEIATNISQQTGEVPAAFAPTILSANRVVLGARQLANSSVVLHARQLGRRGYVAPPMVGAFGARGTGNRETQLRREENYGLGASSIRPYEDESGSNPRSANYVSATDRFRMPSGEAPISSAPAYYTGGAAAAIGIPGAGLDPELESHFSMPSAQILWEQLDEAAKNDPALAAVAKVFLGCSTDQSTYETLARRNVVFPMTILLARALAVYETYSLYFIQAGTDTMITRFGQALTTWSNESQRQVYSLTVAFKSKTTLINERNVYHVPNAFICGIKRGFGVTFFDRAGFKNACQDNGHVGGRDSLIAIAEPYEPYLHRKLNSTICLTGKFKFLDFNYQDDPTRNDELHYYNVYRTNRYWGFYQIGKDERSSERELMMRGKNAGTRFDFVCHAGQSRHYAPHHHGFFYKRKSQGYFPDEIYGSGMITVWREAHKAYPKQTYVGFEDI